MKRKHTPKRGWNDMDPQEVDARSRLVANQDDAARQLKEATKETTEKVGMQGSLGQVNAGSVSVGPGVGVRVFKDGINTVVLGEGGATFQALNNESYFLFWKTDDDQIIVGKIGAFYVETESGIEVVGQPKSGAHVPVAHLMTADANGGFLTGVEVQGTGEMQFDMRTGTLDGVANQRIRLLANKNVTNAENPMLIFELNTKGTAANGLGIDIPFYIENAAGTLKQVAGFRVRYTDVTDGSEDAVVEVLYMLNGTLTAKQLAPESTTVSPITCNMLTRAPDSVGQGTWVRATSANYLYNGFFWNSSTTNGDNFTIGMYLPAGTYKLRFNAAQAPSYGIVKVEVGATNLGNTDLYAAAVNYLNIVEYTGIVIPTGGAYNVKFTVNGKNASSSSYGMDVEAIEFIRTA